MLLSRVRGVVVFGAGIQVLGCVVLGFFWGALLSQGEVGFGFADGVHGMVLGLWGVRWAWGPWILGIGMEALLRMRERNPEASGTWLVAWRRTRWPAAIALAEKLMGEIRVSALAGGGLGEWLFWIAMTLALGVSHRFLPGVFRRFFLVRGPVQKAVVLGGAGAVGEVAHALKKYAGVGVDPVGWVGSAEGFDRPGEFPWLGDVRDLERVLDVFGAGQLVFVEGECTGEMAREAFGVCQKRGVRVLAARTARSGTGLPVRWDSGLEVDFGCLLREPLQNPWNRFAKRILDLLVAVPAVCFAVVPVGLFLWTVLRFQSKGPVFHRQIRQGRDNRPFKIWKFRTMHCGVFPQSAQAVRRDPRIFPLGAWLRRHSLDELPQFLNVLAGEMSTVGPRPHLTEHNRSFGKSAGYHWRSYIKPGITGLAQINGCRGEVRGEEDVRARVEWDIQYLERWSLALDLRIIWNTLSVVWRPPPTAF
jgi:lipopolysaccharide/colanic/teichoic acid biosynthesis glycosyltransferase